MENLRTAMGSRMKQQRKALHMTQEQLAEKLNISYKHYGSVERGNAGLSLENLVELSDILGVSLDYLIKGTLDYAAVVPVRMQQIYKKSSPQKRELLMDLAEAVDRFSGIIPSPKTGTP